MCPWLLKVVAHPGLGLVDLVEYEDRVSGRGRTCVQKIRRFRGLGHVVSDQRFVPNAVVRRFHSGIMTSKNAVVLGYPVWRVEIK